MAKVMIKNKSSVKLHGLKVDGQVPIEVDENGTPLDKHWRRRLRDKSIEVVVEPKKETKKKAIKHEEEK